MFSQSIVPAILVLSPVVHAVANLQISAAVRSASASSSISSLLSSYTSAVAASFSSHASLPSATTTGAVSSEVTATAIPVLPPGPDATSYVGTGELHAPQPAPYTPAGGLDTNGSEPVYTVQSDFDFESLALALYQEYIELDLFHHGLAQFSDEEFEAAGIDAAGRFLIEFMADQEVGHAQLITNLLGAGAAPKQCSYQYPFTTVQEWIDFSQKITRIGESGVFGFLKHLNSGPAAQLLTQSISTESRQQMIFRQFEGLFSMPVWFETGIPQSWAWTLLSPHIASCPENQTRLVWQNFPSLTIENQPNPYRINVNDTGINETISSIPADEACDKATCGAAISHNRTQLSYPGRTVQLSWEDPGVLVGPNQSYVTATTAGDPKFVIWVSQLNATVTELTDLGNNTGYTTQPGEFTYATDPAVNGTMFIALLDSNVTVTPYNISMINPYVRAGPAIYQSG